MKKTNFLKLVYSLFDVAKKDKWEPHYDKELDYFYWTKKKLSRDVVLIKYMDEFSIYATPAGKVEGLLLEYAQFNFVSHHKEFKPLFKAMTRKVSGDVYTTSKEKEKKVEYLLENIADKVAKETLGIVAEGIKIENFLKA